MHFAICVAPAACVVRVAVASSAVFALRVAVAARVVSAAHGGQILSTQPVLKAVHQQLEPIAGIVDLGEPVGIPRTIW